VSYRPQDPLRARRPKALRLSTAQRVLWLFLALFTGLGGGLPRVLVHPGSACRCGEEGVSCASAGSEVEQGCCSVGGSEEPLACCGIAPKGRQPKARSGGCCHGRLSSEVPTWAPPCPCNEGRSKVALTLGNPQPLGALNDAVEAPPHPWIRMDEGRDQADRGRSLPGPEAPPPRLDRALRR